MTTWMDLDGVANMRDLVGLRAGDGRTILPHRLIRSDNLDSLTARDVAVLVGGYEVSDVIDLRTNFELARVTPSLLHDQPGVSVHLGSLYFEDDPSSAVAPWHVADAPSGSHVESTADHYVNYLRRRPEVILADMRVIASARGATIVHCAAGKDRTGTLVGLLLHLLGVSRADIVADYRASGERLDAIMARLGTSAANAGAAGGAYEGANQSTPGEIMEVFLDRVDAEFGGPRAYLDSDGWTDADQALLEEHLLGGTAARP